MFGRMSVERVLELQPHCDVEAAVAGLLEITENAQIVRWVQFPAALLVFFVVPGDLESGAIYVLDRRLGTWMWIDFADQQYGGYSRRDLDCLLRECQFLSLVERPGLLRSHLQWVVQPGTAPEAAV